MKIFQDIITETEIISDSYPMTLLFDGAACEVQSRMIVKGDVNVDVGCGNAFGGKNEEEEEGAAGGSNPVEKVNDLIDAFGYEGTSLDKAEWQQAFKAFVKEVLEKRTKNGENADSIAKFKANAANFLKYVGTKFDDLTIYTPKDYDSTHSLVFSYWKEGNNEAPVFLFYLDGCKGVKV